MTALTSHISLNFTTAKAGYVEEVHRTLRDHRVGRSGGSWKAAKSSIMYVLHCFGLNTDIGEPRHYVKEPRIEAIAAMTASMLDE